MNSLGKTERGYPKLEGIILNGTSIRFELLRPPGMVSSKICFWPGPEYLGVNHIL